MFWSLESADQQVDKMVKANTAIVSESESSKSCSASALVPIISNFEHLLRVASDVGPDKHLSKSGKLFETQDVPVNVALFSSDKIGKTILTETRDFGLQVDVVLIEGAQVEEVIPSDIEIDVSCLYNFTVNKLFFKEEIILIKYFLSKKKAIINFRFCIKLRASHKELFSRVFIVKNP